MHDLIFIASVLRLCCDPTLRLFAERAAQKSDQVREFADDLAFATLSMEISLPRLALAFVIIEKATGLWLKRKKHIIHWARSDCYSCWLPIPLSMWD
eukprot:3224771-Heterocapsa_arctica.AAC.1